jgi:hypothetical protein
VRHSRLLTPAVSRTGTDARKILYLFPARFELAGCSIPRLVHQLGLAQCRHFVPFVASADGLPGPEAHEVLRHLSFFLAEKWSRPYSAVCGYVNARLSLALVRGSSLCLQ